MDYKKIFKVGILAMILSSAAMYGTSAWNFGGGDIAGIRQNVSAPISWKGTARMTSDKEGVITLVATIGSGWHLYGMKMPQAGPQATQIKFEIPTSMELTGRLTVDKAPVKRHDDMFDAEVEYWESGVVTFTRPFKLTGDAIPGSLKCEVRFMGCNDETCLSPQTKSIDMQINK